MFVCQRDYVRRYLTTHTHTHTHGRARVTFQVADKFASTASPSRDYRVTAPGGGKISSEIRGFGSYRRERTNAPSSGDDRVLDTERLLPTTVTGARPSVHAATVDLVRSNTRTRPSFRNYGTPTIFRTVPFS